MKKVISIIVALALMLSLGIAATPVLADVTVPTVEVDPAVVNEVASYTITFNITSTLAGGATVSVRFPTGTTVPATSTYQPGDITVQGWPISHGDIVVSGQVVTITLPDPIGAIAQVTVVFTKDAGIKNPTVPKSDYTLEVKTSKETNWVTSQQFSIPLPDKSSYEFVYAPPALISKGSPAEVGVTLKTKVLGSAGYPQARIDFSKDSGPGNVTFQAKYGETWSDESSSGSWPPSSTFDLKANHNQTIQFKLTFSEVGVYTLSFSVVDVATNGTLVFEDKPTLACAGVTEVVELKEGWNLVSLPIIPVNSAITEVLAGIMDDVKSVWYYNPTVTDPSKRWQSYVPGPTTPTLTKIEDGKAYWIDMKEQASLTVAGVAIVLPGQVPPTYSVREGWNMVGFKSRSTNTTVEDYLQGTKWVRVLEFENGNWRSLQKSAIMTPGLGYWVAFSEPGIIYP